MNDLLKKVSEAKEDIISLVNYANYTHKEQVFHSAEAMEGWMHLNRQLNWIGTQIPKLLDEMIAIIEKQN